MNKLLKGVSYTFKRNIGWQDRAVRTIIGVAALLGSFYFFKNNLVVAVVLAVLAIAQFWTVLSAKCIACYFMGKCTISNNEKKRLNSRGIDLES